MNKVALGGDKEHYSASQLRNWLDCPARTVAEQSKKWKRDVTAAMLIGSWIDVKLLTPEIEETWLAENKDDMVEAGLLSKKDGSPLSPAKIVESMAQECRKDEAFMRHITGEVEYQVELTANLYGYKWVAHVDILAKDRLRVTDLKSTKSLTDMQWVEHEDILTANLADVPKLKGGRGNFIEQHNYWRQLLIYHDIVQYNFDTIPVCSIAAISQTQPCDRGVFVLDNTERMAYERERVVRYMDTIEAWKRGLEQAPMCGTCAYCRTVKKAATVVYSGPSVN